MKKVYSVLMALTALVCFVTIESHAGTPIPKSDEELTELFTCFWDSPNLRFSASDINSISNHLNKLHDAWPSTYQSWNPEKLKKYFVWYKNVKARPYTIIGVREVIQYLKTKYQNLSAEQVNLLMYKSGATAKQISRVFYGDASSNYAPAQSQDLDASVHFSSQGFHESFSPEPASAAPQIQHLSYPSGSLNQAEDSKMEDEPQGMETFILEDGSTIRFQYPTLQNAMTEEEFQKWMNSRQ